jgi:uncharacterized protein (DUF2141 family)
MPKTVWQENHGNLLLVFVTIVFAIGAVMLLYRQNRFVPVRFPDGRQINVPAITDDYQTVEIGNDLLIAVNGAASDRGLMRIAFYESPETFNDLEKSFLRVSQPIVGGLSKVVIPYDLVPERFAVAVFHDENENGIMDRNAIGIPTEPYGFSSGARGITGPPSYEAAATDRPPMGGTMEVSIR